jgi:hypothetical protein
MALKSFAAAHAANPCDGHSRAQQETTPAL